MPDNYSLEIIEHRQVAAGHWELVLPKTGALCQAAPGQFVTLLVREPSSYDPFLRRPLSIYRMEEDRWSVLYRVVGRGTAHLATFRPGARIDCLGPLGRGFPIEDLKEDEPVALIGGGVGVPPLYFLSQRLGERGIVPEVYTGFASSAHVVAVDEWQKAGIVAEVATDDGSLGYQGFVTELAEKRLARGGIRRIYACGPRPMLRALATLAHEHGVECHVAMEEWMACGVGVCLSCVLKVNDAGQGAKRWARVCREGPVFDSREVVWSHV